MICKLEKKKFNSILKYANIIQSWHVLFEQCKKSFRYWFVVDHMILNVLEKHFISM